MSRRYALTDRQWAINEPLLPGRESDPGRTARDNRLLVEAVIYRYRTGMPWRNLPERFGDYRVIHTRHMRWSRKGTWKKIFRYLASDADNEYCMIDATIVRAHQDSAGAKNSTKKKSALGKQEAD